jgi:hypothetical protein
MVSALHKTVVPPSLNINISLSFLFTCLTAHLIQKNYKNVIYFVMTCFIIVYILSIFYKFFE